MTDWLLSLYANFFGSDVLVAPEYLLVSVLTAWIVFRLTRPKTGFWRWLVPKAIYTHKSHILDLKLFVIGRLMTFLGLFARVTFTTLVAARVARLDLGLGGIGASLSPIALALVLWLCSDLITYWIHRAFHQLRLIWPLHAVHHSAEVMTPFSAYRQHPLALLLAAGSHSMLLGVIQGLIIGTAAPETLIMQIAGLNAFYVLANLAMANFHHSHIWISYGYLLNHILISPAQHQIHHSTDPAHFNRNFGQTLALWDWLFGTLYVPQQHETIKFGLTAEEDAPLMTHQLFLSLWSPLRRIIRTRRTKR